MTFHDVAPRFDFHFGHLQLSGCLSCCTQASELSLIFSPQVRRPLRDPQCMRDMVQKASACATDAAAKDAAPGIEIHNSHVFRSPLFRTLLGGADPCELVSFDPLHKLDCGLCKKMLDALVEYVRGHRADSGGVPLLDARVARLSGYRVSFRYHRK